MRPDNPGLSWGKITIGYIIWRKVEIYSVNMLSMIYKEADGLHITKDFHESGGFAESLHAENTAGNGCGNQSVSFLHRINIIWSLWFPIDRPPPRRKQATGHCGSIHNAMLISSLAGDWWANWLAMEPTYVVCISSKRKQLGCESKSGNTCTSGVSNSVCTAL